MDYYDEWVKEHITNTCLARYINQNQWAKNVDCDGFDASSVIGPVSLGVFLSFFVWLVGKLWYVERYNKRVAKGKDIPTFDIKDDYYDVPHKVNGGARVKHRVILVRHGESEHNKRHDGKDGVSLPEQPDLDTQLTEAGKHQAIDVGRFLSALDWHPDIIRVSPMTRTRQTSRPFLRKLLTKSGMEVAEVEVDTVNSKTVTHTVNGLKTEFVLDAQCMEVNTWGDQELGLNWYMTSEESQVEFADRVKNWKRGFVTKKETYNEFIERVRQWKKTLENDSLSRPHERIQTVAFTHSMVISELLNLIVDDGRKNMYDEYRIYSKVYWQVSHGSITCIDFMDNGEWHIHAMNYMGHLSHYTGLKFPLV